MKTIHYILVVLILFAWTINAKAQNKCCSGASTQAPEITGGFYGTDIPIDENTPGISLSISNSTDLPVVEFLITKRGELAKNGQGTPDTTGGGGNGAFSGDVIVGTSDFSGVFKPMDKSRYGVSLAIGDTFDITAFGYDLNIVKKLADSLLIGESDSGPCCGLFVVMAAALQTPSVAGFCDSANTKGIFTAADINNMSDVITIFDVFSTGDASVASVVSIFQVMNSNGFFISTQCGGIGANNFMPYGVNKNKKYGYRVGDAVAVRSLSAVSSFVIFPNPAGASEVVNAHFTTSKQVDLNINVYDALGQRVYAQTLGEVSGNFSTQIPVSNLTSGVYMIELTDGYNQQVQKIVVR